MSRAFKIIFALLLTVPLTIVLVGFVLLVIVFIVPIGIILAPFIIFDDLANKQDLLKTDAKEEDD
jgi:hypothetical protein